MRNPRLVARGGTRHVAWQSGFGMRFRAACPGGTPTPWLGGHFTHADVPDDTYPASAPA